MYDIIKVKGAEVMSYQQSFTDMEYANRKKKTKREEFLEMMDEIIPWDEWVSIIVLFYPSGKRGRPTRGIETMLRMHLLQNWFSLSDEGVEDAIYDSYSFRKFMKIDFFNEQVPDATTLCKFRKLLVDNGIQKLFFKAISSAAFAKGSLFAIFSYTEPHCSIFVQFFLFINIRYITS